MPQPIRNVNPHASFNVGSLGDSAVDARPALALSAMRALVSWSTMDSFWSGLFVRLLGSSAAAGAAMYASLSGSAAQKASVRAVAKLMLTEDQNDIYEGLLKIYGSLAKERAKLAHWVWGYSNDIPDGLLLCDPAMLIDVHVRGQIGLLSARDFGDDAIYVFCLTDLDGLTDQIDQLSFLITRFRKILEPFMQTQVERGLEALLGEPRILGEVNRRRKDRKLDPLVAPSGPP